MLDFLQGNKTKIGALGAALAAIAAALNGLATAEIVDLGVVLAALKQCFLALGGYGIIAALRNALKARIGA